MSESEKGSVVQGHPNDQDEINTDELDAVSGGVLALQELESVGGYTGPALSSSVSEICCN